MKFAIENERHITSDVEGLLGFTMAQSYEVKFRLNSGVHQVMIPHGINYRILHTV